MKKLTSILLTMLIILSALPIQITVSAEETNEPELPEEETGYSLNLPFYLDDQEARCFLGFLFDTRELTQEQITNGNAYAFLTGQLSGDNEIESGFVFKDLMDAQLSRVVDTYEYGTEVGKQWILDYLYLKAKKTPNLAQSIVSETLHTISSNGIDYILDEYTVHGGPLQEMEFEYIQGGRLIKGLYDKITSVTGKVDYYKKMMLALAGSAFYAGGTNRLEMYKYFLFCKENMVYRHKYSEDIYQLVLSQQGLNEHVVAIKAIQPTLANWDFLDDNMLLWGTEERMALMEKWADFAYCLEDGLSQFPKNEFVDEEGTTSSTDPTATDPDETEPVTQPTTSLPDIDETHSGKVGDCSWYLNTRIGTLYILGSGAMASYSSASSYPWYEYRGYVKRIYINNGVTNIGSYAFYGYTTLISISLSENITSIGDAAFYNCSGLKSLTLPTGLTTINNSAFSGCTSISGEVIIPNGVETICENAFYNNKEVPRFIFQNGLVTIGSNAFSNCTSIAELNLPNSLKEIGGGAFSNCSNIANICVPEKVTNIGGGAFSGCTGVTGTIEISKSVQTIGYGAFDKTKPSKMIVPFVGQDRSATYGKTCLLGYWFPTTYEGAKIKQSVREDVSFSQYFGLPTNLKELCITDAEKIAPLSLNNCSFIETISLNDGIIEIGDAAFYNCSGLNKAYYYGSDINNISIGNGNEPLIRLLKPITDCIEGHSISLNGDIGINFFVDVPDEEVNNGKVNVDFTWTVDSEEKTYSVTLNPENKTDYGYKASCPVAVAEMTYDVTAVVTIDGVTQCIPDTYSAQKYAKVILNNENNFRENYIASENGQGRNGEQRYNELVTLVQTMLDYGTKAQVVFNRNTEYPANEGTDYFNDETYPVTADIITTTEEKMDMDLSAYGLRYKGSTVVYLSETSIRHYYYVDDWDSFNIIKDSVTFDEVSVGYTEKDGAIYFEKKGVSSANLDTPYILTIKDKSCKFAVNDYIRHCLESTKVSDNTKALVKATYRYNVAANAFFEV